MAQFLCELNREITNIVELQHYVELEDMWLNECGEVRVNKQMLIVFSIGKYSDEILCDVVPMHGSRIVLGMSWQYDRHVTHDGFKNKYSFINDGRSVTLVPLTPKQMCEDQEAYLSANKLTSSLPSTVVSLLHEYKDVFLVDMPNGLPPIRGIEHQIDFIPRATIPNCMAYKSSPGETKELQRQVEELLAKGHMRESMSLCAVPMLLLPKKDGS
ncbi:uncharacterized protein LOC131151349 [Malania oleifera]|uniref:uncharacterized protein LOC131151349 n=1 Tax=Malania oleifera TaxID=397392 RepID=UPI0025ADE82F|nr:uncharacterized protein LOC131151349 [Malania oleifera]